MKHLKLLVLLVLLFAKEASSQTIYSQTVNTIDGTPISFTSYQGKKILVLITTSNPRDTASVNELAAFQNRYGDTVKLVGIISTESGYADSNKTALKNLYQSKSVDVILTEPMTTIKTSTNSLNAFIEWLTTEQLNSFGNYEIDGIGNKFFVNEQGKLYAAFISPMPLLSKPISRVIKIKPRI